MFDRGDIVWGKLRTYPWWPAIVLNPEDCGRNKVEKDKVWIFWCGDHKVTQVKCSQVLDFQKHFVEKCVPKMGKSLKVATQEALTILAARCNIRNSDPSSLFEWAKKGFLAKSHLPSTNSKSFDLPDIVINALQKIAFKRKHESTSEGDSEDEIDNVLSAVSKGNTSLEDICVMCCQSNNSVVMPHPFFIGGVCENCQQFITKIMKSPQGHMHDICILCGQGGNLVYCCNNLCLSAYCETCIDYMTPKETLSKILKDDHWECFLCLPNPDDGCLIKKREVYLPFDLPSIAGEKTPICVMGLNDAVISVLMEKMIAINSFSYAIPNISDQKYTDYSTETEDINPDFIYSSFFVSSTAVDKDESQEKFFALFYQFVFKLSMTRSSKPYVFFMYICDDEILDELIKKRVKRFLQVNPTKIQHCLKKVYLWTNLPPINGINDNTYHIIKSRGPNFIEEDILNKFLEPLKNFFMQD